MFESIAYHLESQTESEQLGELETHTLGGSMVGCLKDISVKLQPAGS